MRSTESSRLQRRKVLLWSLVILLMVAVFALTWFLGEPAPPRVVQLATGAPDGAYARFGVQVGRLVEEFGGPHVELHGTRGSLENLDLLSSGEVDAAFVQSGLIHADDDQRPELHRLQAIARLYSEPLWVFYRGEPVRYLGELRGLRIGIGPDGSGTQAVARKLLSENGVSGEATTLEPLPLAEAIERFEAGQLDVVFLIAAPRAGAVQRLLRSEGTRLMDFERHQAYARRLPYLSSIEVPAGLLDLRENLPPESIVLLAPSATLMVREDTHPRVVEILTKAAMQIFTKGNLIDPPGAFPSTIGLEMPQHEAARRYMTEGESWLSRNLPYGAVRTIARLKLLLIPLVTVLLPAIKVVPALLRFRIRHILKQHYESLRDVEARIREAATAEELRQHLAEARQLRDDLSKLSGRIPGSYQDNIYHWRLHVQLVQTEGQERLAQLEADGA